MQTDVLLRSQTRTTSIMIQVIACDNVLYNNIYCCAYFYLRPWPWFYGDTYGVHLLKLCNLSDASNGNIFVTMFGLLSRAPEITPEQEGERSVLLFIMSPSNLSLCE